MHPDAFAVLSRAVDDVQDVDGVEVVRESTLSIAAVVEVVTFVRDHGMFEATIDDRSYPANGDSTVTSLRPLVPIDCQPVIDCSDYRSVVIRLGTFVARLPGMSACKAHARRVRGANDDALIRLVFKAGQGDFSRTVTLSLAIYGGSLNSLRTALVPHRPTSPDRLSRGMLIAFEGGEGAGKSTQVEMLGAALSDNDGYAIACTREPGGTITAREIRKLFLSGEMEPMTELLLIEAARADNVRLVIEPHMQNGRIVICDRYTDSTYAYQGAGHGIDQETISHLNKVATGGLVPDLVVLLDIDPVIGLARKTHRDRIETKDLEFHQRVRQGFLDRAHRAHPESRYLVIDASAPVDSVRAGILATVRSAIAGQAIRPARPGVREADAAPASAAGRRDDH